jgi:hypothetical protein
VSPFCLSCGEDLPLDFAGWEIEHCEVCADWPAKDTPIARIRQNVYICATI